MKIIAGIKNNRNPKVTLKLHTCDTQLGQEFNEFYLRFETHTWRNEILERKIDLCDDGFGLLMYVMWLILQTHWPL